MISSSGFSVLQVDLPMTIGVSIDDAERAVNILRVCETESIRRSAPDRLGISASPPRMGNGALL
jgi:hypothetical protein